ncbi:MAG: ATP-binding protein [Oscillospiraceae bacterium]|nr:ATP-binding protein [Oscillospiraceae bacterium]
MTHDGRLLARAREALEDERRENQAEQQRRTDLIYHRIPEIESIDRRMRSQMSDLVRLTLSKPADLSHRLEKLQKENLDLQMRKAELLHAQGFPIDYLDEIVSCKVCGDTGMVDGRLCACMERRYNRELTKELSVLLRSGDESFERFDLSLYPDTPEQESGVSARSAMRIVFSACRGFADSFPDVPANLRNLLLRGESGLGKTYLSACIARSVAERGYSVCYDTASAALEAFEKQKFSRIPEEAEAAALRAERMLSCDLMILDDLGTEMATPAAASALYTLINTRLTRSLHTVISTNCSDDELRRRYSPQICSRLFGEFLELPFYGNDIRLMKRSQ